MVKKIQKKLKWNKLFFILLFIIFNNFYFKKYNLREKILFKGRMYLNRCLRVKFNRKFYTKFVNIVFIKKIRIRQLLILLKING